MRRIFALLLLAASLSGCAAGATAIKTGIVNDAEFNLLVIEDVNQAILLATQSNDVLGLMCWTYIQEFALSHAPAEGVEVGEAVGIFSIYQKARNVRRTIQLELSDDFRMECGPMLTESLGVLERVAIRFR